MTWLQVPKEDAPSIPPEYMAKLKVTAAVSLCTLRTIRSCLV